MYKLKIFSGLIVFAFYTNTNAQLVVSDPAAQASLIESISVSTKSLSATQENLKLAKETIEKSNKINNAIQSSKIVLQIAENLKTVQEDFDFFSKNLNQVEDNITRENLSKRIQRLLNDVDVLNSVISDVTTDNILSMKDGERLNALMSYYDRTNDFMDRAKSIKQLIRRILNK